jgi:hypothetical protein
MSCFSEHHRKQFELDEISLDGYKLSATYCRKFVEKGGVWIFVHENLNYLNINVSKYCKDQDIESCALKLESTGLHICVIGVYRAPCGDFNSFVIGLDGIIKSQVKLNFIIRGGINIHYLMNGGKKDNLMPCYYTIIYWL